MPPFLHAATIQRVRKGFYLLSAVSLCLVGVPSFLGWNLPPSIHAATFAEWHPMQFNTALCFTLLGIGFALTFLGKHKMARPFGLIAALFAALTLFQYLTGIDLRIDELFRTAHYSVLQYPGRMAPNSAVSLVASGLGLFILNSFRTGGRSFVFAGFLGALSGGLGFLKILSTIIGTTGALDPGSALHMPLPTAFGALVAGSLLARTAVQYLERQPNEAYRIAPFRLTLVLIIFTLGIWQIILNDDILNFKRLLAVNTENTKLEMDSRLNETSYALKRFAARLEFLGTKNKAFLNSDSKAYLENISAIKRIGLIDENNRVYWSYPPELQSQVHGFDQSKDPTRRAALLSALHTQNGSLSQSIELRSGGKGFIMPIAIKRNGRHDGFLYGTVELKKLVSDLHVGHSFQITIREDGKTIFPKIPTNSPVDLKNTSTLKWGLATLEIELQPTPEFIRDNRSPLPYFALFSGCIIAVLIGLVRQSLALTRRDLQKNTEKELLFSSRQNIALKSARIGVWSMDAQSGKMWTSQNHNEIYGLPTENFEWSQAELMKIIHPDDRIPVREQEKLAIRAGKATDLEFRIIRPDTGEERWLRVVSRIEKTGSNQLKQIIGVVSDVTQERVEANERKMALDWRKAILGAADYAVISTDENGIIRTFNSAASRMLGYLPEELIGKYSPDILHDETEVIEKAKKISLELGEAIIPGFDVFTAKARRFQVADENEWTYIRKNKSTLPISLSMSVIRDASLNITGYLGIAIDQTQRKQTEADIRVAHERLERIIEATGEGIWERNLSGSQTQHLDAQSKIIFGFDPGETPTYEEVINRIHPDDRVGVSEVIAKHTQEKTRFEIEFRILEKTAGEKMRWCRAKGMILDRNGAPEKLVATLSNITERVANRKKLETALNKANAAVEAKASFLASISHEIRTPLNGIIGMADLIRTTPLTEDQANYAKIIQQSGTNLLGLLNDILDFSKIEAGKLDLDIVAFSAKTTVEDQVDILYTKAVEKGLTLETFVSPDLPAELLGDPGRIGQILLNLIGNALKFTSDGGVAVRALKTQNGSQSEKAIVRFEVEDTGIGLKKSDQEKLFRPFTQADSGIAGKYGGTGLGLSISKRLAEAMGGKIGVESVEGRGSIFWVELPLAMTNPTLLKEVRSDIEELYETRALIIDNDKVTKDTVHRYIISWGMRNGQTASLKDALPLLQSEIGKGDPYHLAIIGSGGGTQDPAVIARELKDVLGKSCPRLILLNEFGNRIDEGSPNYDLFSASVTHPMKQSELFDAFVSSLSGKKKDRKTGARKIAPIPFENTGPFGRILIADDVVANQIIAQKQTEALGHHAVVVANGIEVLAAIQQIDYDLILMDCQMPEMDGFEATAKIRLLEKQTGKHIPIIALTANAMAGDDKKCLDAGMDDYLSKPIRKEKLHAMIQKWLIATGEKKKQAA